MGDDGSLSLQLLFTRLQTPSPALPGLRSAGEGLRGKLRTQRDGLEEQGDRVALEAPASCGPARLPQAALQTGPWGQNWSLGGWIPWTRKASLGRTGGERWVLGVAGFWELKRPPGGGGGGAGGPSSWAESRFHCCDHRGQGNGPRGLGAGAACPAEAEGQQLPGQGRLRQGTTAGAGSGPSPGRGRKPLWLGRLRTAQPGWGRVR